MKTDFEDLMKNHNGARIILYPTRSANLNSKAEKPVRATCSDGYFYCDSSDPELGPDFYWGDVGLNNDGYDFVETT